MREEDQPVDKIRSAHVAKAMCVWACFPLHCSGASVSGGEDGGEGGAEAIAVALAATALGGPRLRKVAFCCGDAYLEMRSARTA